MSILAAFRTDPFFYSLMLVWIAAPIIALAVSTWLTQRPRCKPSAPYVPDPNVLPGVFDTCTCAFFPEPAEYHEDPRHAPAKPKAASPLPFIGMLLAICGTLVPLYGLIPGSVGLIFSACFLHSDTYRRWARPGLIFGITSLCETMLVIVLAIVLA